MLKRVLVFVVIALALPAAAKERPVVVELFTSQACPNCPPAHDLLLDLAEREDILALSWPVDYWDFMGWEDTLAKPAHTERQRAYNRALGEPGVYTPEIVVDGRRDVVGSRRGEVVQAIRDSKTSGPPAYRLELMEEGAYCLVDLFDSEIEGPVTVRAVWYAERANVDIQGGSNQGESLPYVNVVKASREIGRWDGGRRTLKIPLEEGKEYGADYLAVLLEREAGGPILGAATIPVQ